MDISQAIISSMFLTGPWHGYELRKEIKRRDISDWAGISDIKIYRALEQLKKRGVLVSEHIEQQGRPAKELFTITPLGRAMLEKKIKNLAEQLNDTPLELSGFLYLTALGDYSKEKLLAELKRKLEFRMQKYDETEQEYINEAGENTPLVSYLIFKIDHSSEKAFLQWLDRVIRLFEQNDDLWLHSMFDKKHSF